MKFYFKEHDNLLNQFTQQQNAFPDYFLPALPDGVLFYYKERDVSNNKSLSTICLYKTN
jgi:hypothetical protein